MRAVSVLVGVWLVAFATIGALRLIVEFWEIAMWIIPSLLVLVVVIMIFMAIFNSPGARASRLIRREVKHGRQKKKDIQDATDVAMADMNRIARHWKER